jgi:1,4-dihydroxy-6-naphthoate synthase
MLIKYLEMYASDASIELNNIQLKALDKLYEIGFENGLWRCSIKTEEYLIPKEYEALRNS